MKDIRKKEIISTMDIQDDKCANYNKLCAYGKFDKEICIFS